MRVLMIYPEFPDTFWSFKHALSFVGKKSSYPPLGLLTVAAMLPEAWSKRLVDLNVRNLRPEDLEWADYAFISGMVVQKDSARKVIARCKAAGITIVAGGPLFTTEHESFGNVDHFVLNEAESTLPEFLGDLSKGRARRVYEASEFPAVAQTPLPLWELIDMKKYYAMALQYTRGCPFDCEFCNITSMFGHKVRAKSVKQIVGELEDLYAHGWRGRVFFVDDNFIGNKRELKAMLLPALIEWREDKRGISFQTEASINLADDDELMELMGRAGFNVVFVGIETTNAESLTECNKQQNKNRDLVADVKRIQRAGLQVQGGFIVGFDSDRTSVFREQIEFIQRSGIVTAMVGLLQAPFGTRLYKRMKSEGRLQAEWSGDNAEGTTNIVTAMEFGALKEGYAHILRHIYAPKHYYERIKTFLREYQEAPELMPVLTRDQVMAFFRSVYRLGIIGRERVYYWKLVFWTSMHRPSMLPLAVTLAIFGHHFRRVCDMHVH